MSRLTRKISISSMVAIAITTFLLGSMARSDNASNGLIPFAIDSDKMAGKGLEVISPFPSEMTLSGGDENNQNLEVFSGEMIVGIYQTNSTKLSFSDPWPYDQYLQVLNGELRITDDVTGKTKIYPKGSNVIVPKGFTGIWDMLGDPFRELYVYSVK